MIIDSTRQWDGFVSLAGGQDSGRNGILIDQDQCQEIENATCRGGNVTTRPAFRQLTLNFVNNITYDSNGRHGGPNPIGSQSAFQNGLFQGAGYYDASFGADESFIVSVGGRLFRIVPRRTTADVQELYLAVQNRGNIPICYMVQADRFHITQDGESAPIIFDGVVARRAGPTEIFTGTIMAYGMGRIVLIGKNFRDVFFGDLFGSHPGEPGASVLQFTETGFLAEGGASSLPFTMGHITGAIFFPQQDTTQGQGQLLVFAEKGMASFFLNLPRDQWKTSQFQVMGLIEIGGRGHRSLTPVNEDIWFRSGDGWRTYRQARSEAKGWFQLPLSTEVSNFVDVDTENLLNLGSSIHFNNRLIVTCTPVPNGNKPYHNGFLSLDFNVLSSFGKATRPSWDGHWSGLKTTQLVEGVFAGQSRAFAFGLDSGGLNAFYEIDPKSVQDTAGPITSYIVPKSFTFSQDFNENTLYGADIWFKEVRAQTQPEAWFKPDEYPNWVPWHTLTNGKTLPSISPIGIPGQLQNGLPTLREGFYPRRTLEKPGNTPDPTTKRDVKRGYDFDVKLQWTGNASIDRFRLATIQRPEKSTASPTT